jgi:hypothetical protein
MYAFSREKIRNIIDINRELLSLGSFQFNSRKEWGILEPQWAHCSMNAETDHTRDMVLLFQESKQ